MSYGIFQKLGALLLLCVPIVANGTAPVSARQGQPAPPNPAETDVPAVYINMQASAYVPNSVTIRIGQSVEFRNEDDTGHTATASDFSFDSGYLAKGDTWRTTFTRAGTVRFSDIYHPSMHGTIVVIVN